MILLWVKGKRKEKKAKMKLLKVLFLVCVRVYVETLKG